MTPTIPLPPTPMSPLRRRLIEDMDMRRFTAATQRNYIRDIARSTTFLGRPPDTASAEDLRRYQLEQRETGVTGTTMNAKIAALRFFFTHTVDRPDLARKDSIALARQLLAVAPPANDDTPDEPVDVRPPCPLLRRAHDRHRDLRALAPPARAAVTGKGRSVIRHASSQPSRAASLRDPTAFAPLSPDMARLTASISSLTPIDDRVRHRSRQSARHRAAHRSCRRTSADRPRTVLPIDQRMGPAGSSLGDFRTPTGARNSSRVRPIRSWVSKLHKQPLAWAGPSNGPILSSDRAATCTLGPAKPMRVIQKKAFYPRGESLFLVVSQRRQTRLCWGLYRILFSFGSNTHHITFSLPFILIGRLMLK
ncbi:phage integrase N-terminal SAM-like domain-containing protein [Novosphingobium sp. Gsoil 351]|uniref:phage integrase N-terminal SAM-like domain-containing protein n=1 Tax=Novosphingobium sp. Gsoil 351 TaxID=2675225 RepID=UPI0018A81063|nr:phage integrase N-terminal SAM-like domain-containing protein [Novosphingobium sp. Gsoil 351]